MTKPAVKTEQKTTRTRNSRKWRKNPEIRKRGKTNKNAQNQNFPKIPPKEKKNKILCFEQNLSSKSLVKRRIPRWLF